MRAILAIDQGTTNSKAILVSEAGAVISRGASPVGIYYPQPGWVEQDPKRIWQSVCEAVRACLDAGPDVSIEALAVSNQRESVTAWDAETGEPLGPVLSWQCRPYRAGLRPAHRRGSPHPGPVDYGPSPRPDVPGPEVAAAPR
ncbi:pentose kinase (plasmid) [Sinorhizobium fredii CCBAU 25509]|nr:pentose kinase [Sinorhizobium fredii CCBAU 25509]